MNTTRNLMALGAALLTLAAFSPATLAQDEQNRRRGGGPGGQGFDPEQMRQRMEERLREQLEVKDDAEWKIISERIQAVTEARRASGGGFGFFGGGGRGGPGGPGGQGGGGRGRGGSSEAQDLQAALEAKASPEELKAKLAKLREARKANEAKLDKAQEELRAVLSLRQEAVLVVNGLLR